MKNKYLEIADSILQSTICNKNNIHPSVIGFKKYKIVGVFKRTSQFENVSVERVKERQSLGVGLIDDHTYLLEKVCGDEQRDYIDRMVKTSVRCKPLANGMKSYVTKEGVCVITDLKEIIQVVHSAEFQFIQAEPQEVNLPLTTFIYGILKKRFKCDMKIYLTNSFTIEEEDNFITKLKDMAMKADRSIEVRPLIAGHILFYTDDRMEALKVTAESSTEIRSQHWREGVFK